MPAYSLFLILVLLTAFRPELAFALDERLANTSLAVPQQPPVVGYQVVPAFPGLDFAFPVAIVSAPGETNRLFIVEKEGRIQVITNLSAPTKTLFLDLSGQVNAADEGGLLGLAFHPNWRVNGQFFVFYTVSTNVPVGYYFYDRLSRFELDPDNPNAALSGSEQFLISQLDRDSNHNAGDLHFGPDGYLYVSTGDEGSGGDAYRNSRFINKDFFGAILRLDVDKKPGSLEPNPHPSIHTNSQGEAFYRIPPDNPFIGATHFDGQAIDPNTVRTEFWAVGFRNPWRFSFDEVTGTLYCADVGQDLYEEVNIITRGADYGWRYKEGLHDYGAGIPPNTVQESDLTPPIFEYPHSNGQSIPGGIAMGACVIGGVVYNGDRLSQLKGNYVFGDYAHGRIFSLRYDPDTGEAHDVQQLIAAYTSATCFGIDPSSGDVLLAGLVSPTASHVSRLTYADGQGGGTPLPATLSATGAFSDLATLEPEEGVVPYEINAPFWSDHAIKSRWFSIPDLNNRMTFGAESNWFFPTGTVWIKHFELELTNGVSSSRRRLETRFFVKNQDGGHGFTYRWNAAQTDADLVESGGQDETIAVYRPDGSLLRNQTWRYPSRNECSRCHTPQGGYALGFNTAQLNRAHDYGDGETNQIAALIATGYLDGPVVPDPETLPRLAPADDTSAPVEHRARSYLQANCAQCHQPGGTAQGQWDARISTPLAVAGLINGSLLNNYANESNRVIRPGSLENSILFRRVSQMGPGHMPPLATSELNDEAISLLSTWIMSMLSSVVFSVDNDGYACLDFPGIAGRTYRIESSSDLLSWQTVAAIPALSSGSVQYREPIGDVTGSRFYRVAWP